MNLPCLFFLFFKNNLIDMITLDLILFRNTKNEKKKKNLKKKKNF